ncbi:hypothetical protein [Methylophaga sp. OBS4]|uniref:hypothetical protein n=1 Tax=Methylophaga sp. OBS4 TaxID=2991935 RepID=UPI0022584ED5|nr:hypothetical protein [Methylophaga sp. OBS4]MCX4188350.1 hypothetical protein [Methylophaga sp. OBS4]
MTFKNLGGGAEHFDSQVFFHVLRNLQLALGKENNLTTIPSTSKWTSLDFPAISSIRRSTMPTKLPRDKWPAWASSSTQFNRILSYPFIPAEVKLESTLPSSIIAATLLTERIDIKDKPKVYNYNIYLMAESTDGKLYHSPPIRTTNPSHHSTAPSTWFDSVGYQ